MLTASVRCNAWRAVKGDPGHTRAEAVGSRLLQARAARDVASTIFMRTLLLLVVVVAGAAVAAVLVFVLVLVLAVRTQDEHRFLYRDDYVILWSLAFHPCELWVYQKPET